MNPRISPTQQMCLQFIRQHIDTVGYPPTVREIAAEVGCAPVRAHAHLQALHAAGLIRLDGKPRAIAVIDRLKKDTAA